MKFVKILAVTLLITALTCPLSHANSKNEPDPTISLRRYMVKLLRDPDLKKSVDEKVRISFFVTADQELVVLKSDARTKSLDKFIKARLNYKKIDVKNLEVNRIFHIKVHFST